MVDITNLAVWDCFISPANCTTIQLSQPLAFNHRPIGTRPNGGETMANETPIRRRRWCPATTELASVERWLNEGARNGKASRKTGPCPILLLSYAPCPQRRNLTMPDFRQRRFSIRIFVPDGDPDGLRLVEKSNWTGVGVVFNRSNYRDVASRPEFDKTGV
jgi:hypothetical protein